MSISPIHFSYNTSPNRNNQSHTSLKEASLKFITENIKLISKIELEKLNDDLKEALLAPEYLTGILKKISLTDFLEKFGKNDKISRFHLNITAFSASDISKIAMTFPM